ncbi:response regulator transcription factor [Periweissella ghanensis]|uniref:Transcriptional regulatory protein DesR n=1 Tax=Periweissella ghanensis TaxID=467997 RepID=A0ABN8BLQ2_9LACO|nr:response regulator transcription factor [Periweissella ghanensis]MCM0601108.1 response regulator transcription factor [Periweissella ghanensis]CAH0417809.1 Transcriptional regulatory protein DesR [Periweissella ghanensis]
MIKLYLAEDQAMLQSALITILNLEEDLQVVGSALSGTTALNELLTAAVDVAILDIELPGISGLAIADQLRHARPDMKVVILTTFAQPAYFEQALAAKVNGYLLKDSPSDKLIATIHQVLEGQIIYEPQLVIGMYQATQNPLTEREISVLKLLQAAQDTQAIADELHLSNGTVRNYISAVLSKLGAHSRIEAVQIAQTNKWL